MTASIWDRGSTGSLSAILSLAALLCASPFSGARSQSIDHCMGALILDQRIDTTTIVSERRILETVTEFQWSEMNRRAQGSATFKGIPLGASYNEWRKSIQNRYQNYQFYGYDSTTRNINETALSDNAVSAYRDCLNGMQSEHSSTFRAKTSSDQSMVHFEFRLRQLSTPRPPLKMEVISRGGGIYVPADIKAQIESQTLAKDIENVVFSLPRGNPYEDGRVTLFVIDGDRRIPFVADVPRLIETRLKGQKIKCVESPVAQLQGKGTPGGRDTAYGSCTLRAPDGMEFDTKSIEIIWPKVGGRLGATEPNIQSNTGNPHNVTVRLCGEGNNCDPQSPRQHMISPRQITLYHWTTNQTPGAATSYRLEYAVYAKPVGPDLICQSKFDQARAEGCRPFTLWRN